ncbi:MAG: pyrimidine/purine nucleoside phosphorylase [Planctomycetota bacterium]|nr:pyrimidine/purine nucleoside phosphorylase [Planctomycetota bacterium]
MTRRCRVPASAPEKFELVTVVAKANVYFDGRVVSHTVLTKQGKVTLGLIYPGAYKFNTGAPERMDMTAGACRILLPGDKQWRPVAAGTFFKVPGNSAFEIAVDEGIAEYICTFEA